MNKIDRTKLLLANFKGNKDEFMMLKGILCAPHGLDPVGVRRFYDLFDTIMIAERMDQINNEAHEAALRLFEGKDHGTR